MSKAEGEGQTTGRERQSMRENVTMRKIQEEMEQSLYTPKSFKQGIEARKKAINQLEKLGLTPTPDAIESVGRDLIRERNEGLIRDLSTGLFNKAGAIEFVHAAQRLRVPQVELVYIDIDFLKDINNRLGRESTGAKAILMIYRLAADISAEEDGLTFLLSGDEGLVAFTSKKKREKFLEKFDQRHQALSLDDWLNGRIAGKPVIDGATRALALPDQKEIKRLRESNYKLFQTIYPASVTLVPYTFTMNISEQSTIQQQRTLTDFFDSVTAADKEADRIKTERVKNLDQTIREQLKRKSS
jgi:GGDEF domain-containing protein